MDDAQSVLLPHHARHTLADLTPALLTALGVPGLTSRLDIEPARTVCLLLIDGLGWRLLHEHADRAPFLTRALGDGAPLAAGFPSTTPTSVATIGTGLTAGEHGIVGFTFEVPGHPLINTLLWTTQLGNREDLREQLVPEQVQPRATLFERATADGVDVRMAAPRHHRGSGLTRAVLRGATFGTAHALGDLVTSAADALRAPGRTFCYAYHGDLDALGHGYGPGSTPWREQLAFIDHLVAAIASALPEDGVLAVTADHGMVRLTDRINVKDHPELADGVRLLGGEPRMRHVYTEPGTAPDVLARWRSVLGERAMPHTRDEAIAAGWFGPSVADHVRPRIGDLVVPMLGEAGVVQTVRGTNEANMIGQHGSLTAVEQQVPLILIRK